jgi:S1-C subfamily serine protease
MKTFLFGVLSLFFWLALLACDARADDPFLRRTATVRVVEKVGPSVVNITTSLVQQNRPFRGPFNDPTFDRFFRDFFPRQRQQRTSLGSGVIIDREGHVVTNEHVVARAERIRVTIGDGREFDATLVGADPNNDLAVLRLDTDEKVPWTAPGSSEDVLVGEPVIAIGNPFGLSNTVTTGVLSAVDRSIRAEGRVYHGFLQTDASINPGNSGGPLLNAAGQLIGINTAIYGNAQGIGFAIPIDAARRIVDELITRGSIAPVWLGLELQDIDAAMQEVMELGPGAKGALIARVIEGTSAAEAALSRGELITAFDGVPVRSAREFYDLLVRVTASQKVQLTVASKGVSREVPVTAREISPAEIDRLGVQRLGMELEPNPQGGFAVVRVVRGSGAARTGIEAGDVLLGVNGQGLSDADSLRRAVLSTRGRDGALLVVRRGRGRYHLRVPLG